MTTYKYGSLTGDRWIKRIGELNQMAADVPIPPTYLSDIEYYIAQFSENEPLSEDDKECLRRAFLRQYDIL